MSRSADRGVASASPRRNDANVASMEEVHLWRRSQCPSKRPITTRRRRSTTTTQLDITGKRPSTTKVVTTTRPLTTLIRPMAITSMQTITQPKLRSRTSSTTEASSDDLSNRGATVHTAKDCGASIRC
jgi:hypothetical protein